MNLLELAWAAGLLVGEGCIGTVTSRNSSGEFDYMSIQISMYDERAIKRFAATFGVTYSEQYILARDHLIYKVHVRGRPAEKILAMVWQLIKDTDKGDQALTYAKKLGVEEWITGKMSGKRPQLNRAPRGVRKVICG